MEKKQIKINGKIAVEIKINGGLFWKAGGPEPVFHYDYAIINSVDEMESEIPLQYSRSDSKWYALNNLKQLEPYGVYEEVNDIATATYYNGKLINVNGDEYQYVGGQWQLVGKIENTMALVYTFGAGEEWDREKPFPMHIQMKKEQLDQAGWFNPHIMSMTAHIELFYDGMMGRFNVSDFSTGSEYRGEITNDDTWVYFNNPCPNDIMVDMVDYMGMGQIEMYAGSFHADVEYGTIDVDTKEGLYGSDCSFISEPYIKNKIYNIDGYFMTHTDDGCSRVEGVNPYFDKQSYFQGDDTITEFKLFEPNISFLGMYFFSNCHNLSLINCPYISSHGYSFLYSCSNIRTILLPNLSVVNGTALGYSGNVIDNVDFTNCTELASYAVGTYLWGGSTVMRIPNCSTIRKYGIWAADSITEIYAPKCRVIFEDGIYNKLYDLTSLTIPSNAVIGCRSDVFPLTIRNKIDTRCFVASFNSNYFSNKSSVSLNVFGLMPSVMSNNSVIRSVYLPIAWMANSVCYSCPNLEYFVAPLLETWDSCVSSCKNLKSVNAQNASLAFGDLSGCSYLTSANFYNLKKIPNHFFRDCYKLSDVLITNAEEIGYYTFNNCSLLSDISIPNVITISQGAFYGAGLKTITLKKCREISAYAFKDCSSLSKVYISSTFFCDLLYGSRAFEGTLITSTTGSIFVPTSMVEKYKKAYGWSYFSNRIYGLY